MDVVQILRKFARRAPVVWDNILAYDETPVYRCTYCNKEWVGEPRPEGWDDECQHDEGCPWRLAVEYLANLDNEGY